jgi:Putative transcriptional regulator
MHKYNNIFKIAHNDLLPAQGSLLISEPFTQDYYFQRSVVLLVEHGKDGSTGFVLNKKTDYVVNTFFPELEKYENIPIYLGGPVSSNRLFFIHSLGTDIIPGTIKINDNLFFDGDFNTLKQYIIGGNPINGKVKFLLGYSGWQGSQLSTEINDNSWLVSQEVNNKVILLAEGESYWKSSLELLGNKYKAWSRYPKYPHLN